MFSFFSRKHPVLFGSLGREFIHDCASLHAQSFAKGWTEAEFELLTIDRAVRSDCAFGSPAGPVYGFVMSKMALDEAEILTIAVTSGMRNNDVGRSLLRYHIDNLNKIGIRSLFLEVADDNHAAIRIYERTGFAHIGRRKDYYLRGDGSRTTALTMKLQMT